MLGNFIDLNNLNLDLYIKNKYSFDAIMQSLLEGKYPESSERGLSQRVLNATTMDLDCDEPQKDKIMFSFNCNSDKKNVGVYMHLEKLLSEKKLNIFWDFFSNYIDTNKNTLSNDEINKLILLSAYDIKLYEVKIDGMSNSTTYKDDIQTSSSFINYLTNLLTIPNIIQFETHVISYEKVLNNFPNITLGNSQKFELLISHFIKVIYDLTEIQDYNYYRPEQETILEFVKNLGSLGFELRIKDEFQVQAYRIHTLAKHILNCKNFNTSFKEHLAHSFLYHYHNKKNSSIEESDYKALFEVRGCLLPDQQDIEKINEKIYYDTDINLHKKSFQGAIDQLLKGSPDTTNSRLNWLNNDNKLINYINFFKDYIKQDKDIIDEIYLKKVFTLCNAISQIAKSNKTQLRNTDNKLDIKYFKMIQSHIALELNIVKSNSEKKLLLEQANLISKLGDLVIDVIQNYRDNKYSNKTDTNVANIPKSYLDIINYYKDKSLDFINENLFLTSIKEVTKTCLHSEACNTTQIKKQSFEILGGMVRKLESNHKILAQKVINSAKELKEIVKSSSNISDAELGSDVENFLRIRHSRDQILMDKDCKDLFDLNPQDCHPFTPNDTITTSVTPISETTTAIPFTVPHVNQTIPSITTELPRNFNSTSFNQTAEITENIPNDSAFSNSELTLLASAAHGATGILNGIIQYFADKYSRHGEQSSATKTMIIYSSMLAHATLAATFPLMLFKIQEYINQGNEEEAQQLWDTMLIQALPTFISSAGFSLGLQIVSEFTQLLSNRFYIQSIARNTLPVIGVAVNAIKNPLATAVQLSISIATSSLTHFGLKKIFPVKPQHQFDTETINTNVRYSIQEDKVELPNTEKENIEFQPLMEMEKTAIQICNSDSNIDKSKIPSLYFITQVNLEAIRGSLNLLTIHLAGVCSIYKDRIKEKPKNRESLKRILILLQEDLISIQNYQIELGIKEIHNFQGIPYIEAVKTAFKMRYSENFNSKKEAEKAANGYTSHLKLVTSTSSYNNFLSIPDDTNNGADAYIKHNHACQDFVNETSLVENESVRNLLSLMKKINERLNTFTNNFWQIKGLGITLPPVDSIKELEYAKNYTEQIQHEISENMVKKYDNLNQAAIISKKNSSNPSKEVIHRKESVIKDNRQMTSRSGQAFYRTSSGDESTSSGVSTGNSMHDDADFQEQRPLVKFS